MDTKLVVKVFTFALTVFCIAEAAKLRFSDCMQSPDYKKSNCKLAMDGQFNHCSFKNCSQTTNEEHSWWMGSLERKVKLGKVRVIGEKQDLFMNRLNNFKIIIDSGVCAEFKSERRFLDGTFDCNGVTNTIKIQSNGRNFLSLCEVVPIEADTSTSNFETCEQSSQSGDHKCSYAMDGKHDVHGNKQSTLTKSTDRSWWKGILRAKLQIAKVRIVASHAFYKLRKFKILLDGDKICANRNSYEAVEDRVFKCEGHSRTVTIQLYDKGILSLCEVMVIELEKQQMDFVRCEQTSRDGDGFCTKAMDGLHDTCGARESTLQAEAIKHSSWTGYFDKETFIQEVRIVGRNFNNSLTNFRIILDKGKVCYAHNSTKEIQDENFDCIGKTRSVRIELLGIGKPSLCEVIAYTIRQLKPGWILIQQRETPGLDFNKNWNDYKKGFAYSSTDFWMGLEKIYQLTNNGGYGLRLEFESHKSLSRYAEWKNFKIGSEAEKYAMHISGFDASSTIGDYGICMSYTNGREFVTVDRDNALSCAKKIGGGWWMKAEKGRVCLGVHFNNDLRSRVGYSDSSCVYYEVFAGNTKNYECLKKVRMILIKH